MMESVTAILAQLTAASLTLRKNDRRGLIATPRDLITAELAALTSANCAEMMLARACQSLHCRQILSWRGSKVHDCRTRKE